MRKIGKRILALGLSVLLAAGPGAAALASETELMTEEVAEEAVPEELTEESSEELTEELPDETDHGSVNHESVDHESVEEATGAEETGIVEEPAPSAEEDVPAAEEVPDDIRENPEEGTEEAGEYMASAGDYNAWALENGTLTIMSNFPISNFTSGKDFPWYDEREDIKKVVMEPDCSRLPNYAFYDYKNLESFDIPACVQTIGPSAFKGCTKLKNVTLHEGLTEIGNSAFESTAVSPLDFPNTLTTIGASAFKYCSGLETLMIPDGVTSIGKYAFLEAQGIQSVYIGKNAGGIDDETFSWCKNIKRIVVDPDNPYVTAENSILYDKNKTVILKFAPKQTETFLLVPQSVRRVGKGAFYYADSLETVSFLSSLTRIEDSAFCGCSRLRGLECKDTEYVGAIAFSNCKTLKYLYFNTDKVITFGNEALWGCSNLFYICFKTDAPNITINEDLLLNYAPADLVIYYPEGASGYDQIPWNRYTQEPYSSSAKRLLFPGGSYGWTSSFYTGKEIVLNSLSLADGDLVEGRDYYLRYRNNINAGTAWAVMVGMGDYYMMDFLQPHTIKKASQNCQVTADSNRITVGSSATITVTSAQGAVSYTSSDTSVATVSGGIVRGISPGTAQITVKSAGTSNYNEYSKTLSFEVTGGSRSISQCTTELAGSQFPYTGSQICPAVTVKYQGTALTEGKDYTLAYSDNLNAGTGSVQITGKGNYSGSLTKTFTITKIDQEMGAIISISSLKAGETAQITVTGSKGDLAFTSSDAAVASVNDKGLVTALSAGDTVITVTAGPTVNYNQAAAQISVTVEAAPEENGRSIEEISYSFSNSASSFSYPSGYKIPLSSYQIIYGDNTRAEAVYMAHSRSAWGGNCSGLAATSALMTTAGGGVWPHSFKTGASAPRELAVSDTSSALSMNLTTFVEAMHIAQYTEAFSSERKAHVVYTTAIQAGNKNLDSLYNAVKSKAESDIPTVLALVQAGGHAVLAYKTEEVRANESRVYIYDSNFPLQDRYITFYKNDGHYIQWSYDMGGYGEWGTDSSASSISYIAYATLKSIWDSRGHVGRDEASLAFVNSQNFAVYDVNGNLEAIVSDGALSDKTGKISRIEDELSLTGSGTQEVVLSLPTKTHTIVNLDRNLSSFAVNMVDTELGVKVETTVQEVTLSVDDAYNINTLVMDAGESDTYSVTLSNSFAAGYDEIVVNGKGQGETLSISQSGTNLNFSNCDISLLMVDGQQVGVYEITASATEGGSISPSGTTSLRQGESLAYTITPDTGYAIQDVFVDNKSVGAVSSYTFENVRGGHTILATFKKAPATLETPKVSSVTNVKDGVKIAWGRVEGAENYRIYVKANGGGWKRLTETTGTSYTWTGAESGNTYGFTIRCMNAAGTSFTSGYDNTGKSVAYIAAPSVAKMESLAGGVKITWTKSTGAQLYRIYYKEGTGGWKKLTDTTDTFYTWPGAVSGKTYGFTLRCMNAAGTSFTSGYDDMGKTITYVKPSQIPEVTALSAVTGGLKIDWSSFAGAGVYAVYYKTGTGAGGWKKLTNVSGTSYTWTGAVDGTTYSFTVRAMNDAGTSFVSGYNNTGMSIVYKAVAAIPKVTSVTNVQGGVKIAWSAFAGAGSYRIFYKESGGSWRKLCDASGTSYTWTGAVSGSFYAFTVRALNAAGTSYVSGYDNTGKTITYVAAPVITTLKKVSGGIQIGWGTCAGAGSYRIFVKVNGGGWKKLTDLSGTSYTWTGAAAGNTYGFTVRCMDAGSASYVSGYDNTGKSLAF